MLLVQWMIKRAALRIQRLGPRPTFRSWRFATRLTVATVEALSRLPQTELCLVVYDTPVHLVKPLRQLLDLECKHHVMERMGAYSSNSDAKALRVTIDELSKAEAESKMIFHLTDGEFCSKVEEVRKQLARAASLGIQVVILTLDISQTLRGHSFQHTWLTKSTMARLAVFLLNICNGC